jgi:predicted cation transporter
MTVLVEKYFMQVPAMGLYWVNMLSAVLDNATLAAAEVGPALSLMQVKATLMALLVSGGMLIPGNIPNIIAAHKLKIKSKEWARVGIPLGLLLMLFYFVWLFFIPFP